jgi:uncharacterized protein YgbK (DUF1537 family)
VSAPPTVVVADDLTGALDTVTPFAAVGLSVVVPLLPSSLPAALRAARDVIAVNTASRSLAERDALRVIEAIAPAFGRRPDVVLKKIDSRLKGNIGAETAALARAFGFNRIVVAPSVPDQGRYTVDGAVVGMGVAEPLPIAPLFAALPGRIEIVDTRSDQELDALVLSHNWADTLAVGARGLGAAFARRLGLPAGLRLPRSARTLYCIGSRDLISDEQIEMLLGTVPDITVVDALAGRAERLPTDLPALMRCTGPIDPADAGVGERFATKVAKAVSELTPDVLVMSGGDTALAILERLGAGVLVPRGEAPGGLPWFEIALAGGPTVRCVLKSGGFGSRDALAALLPDRDQWYG